MKRSWLKTLALTLGLAVTTTGFGQFPNVSNNFGPSSYSVQQVQMQSVMQSLPQVPQNATPYQLVNAQDPTAIYSQPVQQVVPQYAPAPMAPQPAMQGTVPQAGCQSCQVPTVQQYQAPVDYGYQQMVAPSCNSCGPAPVSAMSPGYAMAPGYVASYGCGNGVPASGFGVGHGQLAGLPTGAKPWFFGASALIFNRVDNNNISLSFLDGSYATDVITSRDARMRATGGVEGTVGRYFNCGKNAIQATYWGLYPTEQMVYRSAAVAGDYQSRIPFTYMEMPPTPLPVAGYYNDSATAFQAHELFRSSTYNSVEVNLLGFAMGGAARNFNMATCGTMFSGVGGSRCGYCGGSGCGACSSSCGTGCGTSKFATGPCNLTAPSCGSRLNMTWLGGFRYFRFTDNFLYATSTDDAFINRSATDMYYEVNTTNDLFGFQFGSRADYCIGKRLNAYGTAKVGVYNNRSTLFTRLGTDTDDAYLLDTRPQVNPNNNVDYRFDVTKNDVAFLSEIGSGLGIRMSPKWTATVGYRAVVASGVATSTDNVRYTFANYDEIRDFDNRGTLILHGLNVGALYNY